MVRKQRRRPGDSSRAAARTVDETTQTVPRAGIRWVRVEVDRCPRGWWSLVAWKWTG